MTTASLSWDCVYSSSRVTSPWSPDMTRAASECLLARKSTPFTDRIESPTNTLPVVKHSVIVVTGCEYANMWASDVTSLRPEELHVLQPADPFPESALLQTCFGWSIAKLVTRLAWKAGQLNSGALGWGCNYWTNLLSVFRKVTAHQWHRSPEVSRQQRGLNPGPSTLL